MHLFLKPGTVISVPPGPRTSIHYLLMKSIGSVVAVSICVGHVAAGESTKLSHLVSHHIALSSSSAATPTWKMQMKQLPHALGNYS